MRFAGKSILITGAASGIGKAAAELFAREGAKRLILVDADAKGLDTLRLDGDVDKRTGDPASGHPRTLARPTMRSSTPASPERE
jgi:NAD(P)-dependent dehydrogenase (short-subunit alcohol dehydrogenase family)